MSTLGKLFVAIGADTSAFKKELNTAVKHMDKTARQFNKIGARFKNVGMGMTKAFTLPMLAAGAALGGLVADAINVQKQMAEVFTLMPGMTQDAMNGMNAEVKKFSKEFGMLPNEVIPALYQAISASVPPDNVFDFMGVAAKIAVGGVTSLEVAVDGLTTVINAYGADVITAQQASDYMFTAVRLGKTTIDELSASLFQVVPVASSLNVGFGEISAGLAAITSQGTPTSVAATQLRQLLVELSKATGQTSKAFLEASGKTFPQFIREGGNLQEALQLMERYAGKNNLAINNLFGSVEAGNAALSLTGGGTETFTRNLEEMTTSAGATETAYEAMEKSVDRQIKKMVATLRIMGLEIADKLLPIINDKLLPIIRDRVMPAFEGFANKVIELIEKLAAMNPATLKAIAAFAAFAFVIGPILIGLGNLIMAFGQIKGALIVAKGAMLGIKGVMVAVGAAFSWPVIAIGAVIGAITLLILNFEKVKAVGQKVADWFRGAFGKDKAPRYTVTAPTPSPAPSMGNIPQLATGTNYVPRDMVAQLHKGEKVTPAKYNHDKAQGNMTVIVELDGQTIGRVVEPYTVGLLRVATRR
jgi:TP901 family phage tail tape measure protein